MLGKAVVGNGFVGRESKVSGCGVRPKGMARVEELTRTATEVTIRTA